MFCGAGSENINVTSNIFALEGAFPLNACIARHSVFDDDAMNQAADGVNNIAADSSTFFKDWQDGDYSLVMGSPALGTGEPNLVSADIAGSPRPYPDGSNPDSGAYEGP